MYNNSLILYINTNNMKFEDSIVNWRQLTETISVNIEYHHLFKKLLSKLQQTISTCQKTDSKFNLDKVEKNQQEVFNNYKYLYHQLLIEKDITDIMIDVLQLSEFRIPNSKDLSIGFNMIGIGKWIKFHLGNSKKIKLIDEEKSILNNKILAQFLNKIQIIKKGYKFFGQDPKIYCKFVGLPNADVINYFASYGVTIIDMMEPTPVTFPDIISKKIILDQSILLSMCSNLSFGLSGSFFDDEFNKQPAHKREGKTPEIMLQNKRDMDEYFSDKEIILNRDVYEQSLYKITHFAGPNEKIRFSEFCKRITIVPDVCNPRFYYLKNSEKTETSVAEENHAIMVTGNLKFCHKLQKYYPEIKYKHFISAPLTEDKYP